MDLTEAEDIKNGWQEYTEDCKEIQPVHPKGNQFWISIGRTDVEAETPILWPPNAKSWLIWKDPNAGNDWRQEEKRMTQDESWMASPTQWTWVWVNAMSWWWTGRPDMLQSMGSQRLRHDWATELNWSETMVEVMKIMVTSSKRSLACSGPSPVAGPFHPKPPPETPGFTGKSGSVSYGVTAPFSWVLVLTRFCLCPPRVCVPVLCKFWLLYGGVSGDLLQERLYHTQVRCIQSPRSCGSLLLTHTSTRDTQIQFYLSLFRVSGSWCAHSFLSPLSISGISV